MAASLESLLFTSCVSPRIAVSRGRSAAELCWKQESCKAFWYPLHAGATAADNDEEDKEWEEVEDDEASCSGAPKQGPLSAAPCSQVRVLSAVVTGIMSRFYPVDSYQVRGRCTVRRKAREPAGVPRWL